MGVEAILEGKAEHVEDVFLEAVEEEWLHEASELEAAFEDLEAQRTKEFPMAAPTWTRKKSQRRKSRSRAWRCRIGLMGFPPRGIRYRHAGSPSISMPKAETRRCIFCAIPGGTDGTDIEYTPHGRLVLPRPARMPSPSGYLLSAL